MTLTLSAIKDFKVEISQLLKSLPAPTVRNILIQARCNIFIFIDITAPCRFNWLGADSYWYGNTTCGRSSSSVWLPLWRFSETRKIRAGSL